MKQHLVLLTIILLAFSIRIFLLSTAPSGALVDEAHFGFIAKSLLETGRDEHGVLFPLIFKGFGDDKLPAMAYFMTPFVKIFGLSIFSIRFPSVLIGVCIVLAIYALLRELRFSKNLSLFGAFVTAISPWTFVLSRFGFESNLALLFFIIGLIFFFRFQTRKSLSAAVWAAVFFGATWYAYIAYRPVTVIFAVLLALLLWRTGEIAKLRKLFLVFFLVLGLSVLPLFLPGAVKSNATRLKQVGIFYDPGLVMQVDENRTFCAMKFSRLICDAAFNKPVVLFTSLLDRWSYMLSPQYLATQGELDQPVLNSAGFGQFFPVAYALLVLGLFAIFVITIQGKGSSLTYSILIGLLVSPIPALLVGQPQRVRLSVLYPFALISIVYGLRYLFTLVQKPIWQRILSTLIVFSLIFYTGLYLTDFWSVHTTKREASYESYLPRLFSYLKQYPIDDENIEIVFKPFFSDPLMFYAFYTDIDPRLYQSLAGLGELESSGFQHTVRLGNMRVENSPDIIALGCDGRARQKQILLVTDRPEQAPELHKEKSSNDVHTYLYVYDATGAITSEQCL
ncbi:MAG: glycosyltransferase family 39 protein [Candidatus Pacebacteria bacterium]|nr:glycosyltransferase family 39 protein [Candidatus Paceibacterota bacterium]PIR61296.1 MAG: hypothetical protein COU68_00180 [Candidatus Pacebacteria bacterium CG10_big_fil_rev_8_21_14_0_10_45_6]